MKNEYLNENNIYFKNNSENIKEDEFKFSFSFIFKKQEIIDEKKLENELYFNDCNSNDNTKNTSIIKKGIQYINNPKTSKEENLFLSSNGYEKSDKMQEQNLFINNKVDKINKPIDKNNIIKKKEKLETLGNSNDVIYSKNNASINQENNIFSYKIKKYIRGPYKKRKTIIKTKIDDKCFPFTSGKGLVKCNNNNWILEFGGEFENKENIGKYAKKIQKNIFITKQFVTDSKGKRKKIKKQRKFKSDDVRKKIKVNFHKTIKNIINENLKNAGSEELLSFLPQSFMGNISKKFNNKYLDITYEQLLSIDFSKSQTKSLNLKMDQKQYIKNIRTLKYLKNNQEISRISGFDLIKNMKYRDLLKLYFLSSEFENSIIKLKNKQESKEYIDIYIYLAKNYVKYFSGINNCEKGKELDETENSNIGINKSNDELIENNI